MAEGSSARMWRESEKVLRDTIGMVDDEFADLTMDLLFGQLYGREDKLDLKTRELCIIATLTALHKPEEIKTHLTAAFNLGWTYEELREIILISVLTTGWPAVADALRQLVGWCLEKEVPLAAPGPRRQGYAELDWYDIGVKKCQSLFGEGLWQEFRDSLDLLDPDLKKWAVSNLFGRMLTRGRLDDRTVCLCLTTAYAALRSPRMLRLFIAAAFNSGAAAVEIKELLFLVGLYAGQGAVADAVALWKEVQS